MNTKIQAALAAIIGILALPCLLLLASLGIALGESFGILRNQNLITGVLYNDWSPTILESAFWTKNMLTTMIAACLNLGCASMVFVLNTQYELWCHTNVRQYHMERAGQSTSDLRREFERSFAPSSVTQAFCEVMVVFEIQFCMDVSSYPSWAFLNFLVWYLFIRASLYFIPRSVYKRYTQRAFVCA